jgi:hypothetical protein
MPGITPPPDWLGQFEEESMCAFGSHPEKRYDDGPQRCPQCEHARHYGTCQLQIEQGACGCPGGTFQKTPEESE